MKKLNRKFLKGTNWALAGVQSMLGFASCKEIINGEPAVEYGVPYAEYVVKGKVTDEVGEALSGVSVTAPEMDGSRNKADTLRTASDGTFKYQYEGFPTDSVSVKMKFEREAYETDSVNVEFTRADLKGGKGWDSGSATKEVTVKLKAKKQDGK